MRRFWWSPGLVALLALVLPSCHNESGKGTRIDPNLSSYVPTGVTLLGGVNFDGLRAAPFYRRHQDLLNVPAVNDLSERIGLDPRRDLASLVLTWAANQPLFLARGSFSASQVEPRLLALGSHKLSYSGQTLLGDGNEAVMFPRSDVIAAGSPQSLHQVLDAPRGDLSQALRERLENIPATDQIWFVSTEGLPVEHLPSRTDVQSALSNIVADIRALDLGIGVDEGVHLRCEMICVSEPSAKRVHDAMRGAIGMGRLSTPDSRMDLLKLYDAIQVDQDHSTVKLHVDLPADQADQLMTLLPSLSGRAEQMLRR